MKRQLLCVFRVTSAIIKKFPGAACNLHGPGNRAVMTVPISSGSQYKDDGIKQMRARSHLVDYTTLSLCRSPTVVKRGLNILTGNGWRTRRLLHRALTVHAYVHVAYTCTKQKLLQLIGYY